MASKEYDGQQIKIRYDVGRCIRARECAKGVPSVFDPKARPWINPDGAPDQQIAEVILKCPTGALHFESKNGTLQEKPDRNQIRTAPNGPHYVRGNIEIRLQDGTVLLQDTRVALCRCGASSNKPFCDNSHLRTQFQDHATWVPEYQGDGSSVASDKLVFTPLTDAFLQVDGNLEIQNAEGKTIFRGSDVALCRCGGSSDKPFCDGTHSNNGFRDEPGKQ